MTPQEVDAKILKNLIYGRSNKEAGKRVGLTAEQYKERKRVLLDQSKEEIISPKITGETKVFENKFDITKGTGTMSRIMSYEPMSAKEIEIAFKLDLNTWKLSTYWNKAQSNGTFLVSANVTLLKKDDPIVVIEDMRNSIKEVFQDIVHTPLYFEFQPSNGKSLMVYTSDKHVGAYVPENGLYRNDYSAVSFEQRMRLLLKEIIYLQTIYGVFENIYILDLGDSLDGMDAQTTRKGHYLPQNMSNKEAYKTYLKVHKEFFDDLLQAKVANNIIFTAITNDNHCFTEDMEILTEKGWKFYSELKDDDYVGTLNIQSNVIEYQIPTKRTFNAVHNGVIHNYKNNYFVDFSVTEKHRIFHNRNLFDKSKKTFDFVYSDELLRGGQINFKVGGTNLHSEYPLSDNIIKLAAWIATDGTCKRFNGVLCGYDIYQVEDKLQLVTDILDQEEICYKVRPKNQITTSICGTVLVEEQKQLYTVSINKKHTGMEKLTQILQLIPSKHTLPKWLSQLSKRQFDLYLNSFIDGDGTRKKGCPGSAVVYGVNLVLDQLQILCIKNGHRANIRKYRNSHYRLNITFDTNQISFKPKKCITETLNYTGYTWCLTVPNSTLVVRKNGKVIIQGNSGDFGYMSNSSVEIYLNAKYPQVKTKLVTKFIDHFLVGNHTFVICHGKDDEDMKHGLPLHINDKVTNFIGYYLDYHKLDHNKSNIHFIKGDLHQNTSEEAAKFRYRNVTSMFGSSKWAMHNFIPQSPGVSFDIVENNTNRIFEYKMKFNTNSISSNDTCTRRNIPLDKQTDSGKDDWKHFKWIG